MRNVYLCALASLLGALLASGPAPAAEAPAEVTFSEHIAPIVIDKCASCHRPGEAAPFNLLNYRDVHKRGKTILRVIQRRYMPPWQPEPGYGEFKDEMRLTDQQIALFKRWVESGMAEGDPKKLPKLPDFTSGWHLGKPDLVVKMEQTFDVPEDGPDIYRNFVIPLNLKEDKWVTAVEVRPSERTVVHHMLYFLDNSGRARKQDGKDGKPGFPGMGFRATGFLGGWAVGGIPTKLPHGLALPLSKDSDLVIQTHFHPSGKAEKEQLTVGLYFADKPPSRTLVSIQLPPAFGLFSGLDIPAGKADYTIKDSFTLPVDVDLVGASSHAHYIGKSMKGYAVLPDGKEKQLYYIRDWDFNWQGSYLYKDFIRLPRGTVLHSVVTWDNSADNPRNPNNPPMRITWGEGTADEMGQIRFSAVAANEKDTPELQKAIKAHVRKTVLEAVRRGDKIDLKRFGIELDKLGPQGKVIPRPRTEGVPEEAKQLSFKDLQGRTHQPLSTEGSKANVLFFVLQDCPISNSYSPEISALVKEYADQPVRFYVVQTDPDLKPEAARKHASEFGLTCPVLLDGKHQLVKATSVTTTPEVAVVKPDGSIAYRGRIDDLYPELGKKRLAPTQRDLREALSAVLAGKPVPTARTAAVGCLIPDVP